MLNLKKELAMKAFQNMNIGLLNVILEEGNYGGTNKEAYLKRIGLLFSELREAGDTALELYEGFCYSEHCVNCGTAGVMLVGNISRMFTNIIFEPDPDEPFTIIECFYFVPDELPETTTKKNMFVHWSEESNLENYEQFESQIHEVRALMEELYDDNIHSLKDVIAWKDRNERLEGEFHFSEDYPEELHDAGLLITALRILDYVEEWEQSLINVIEEYDRVSEWDAEKQLHWLVRYEHLHDDFFIFFIKLDDSEYSGESYFLFNQIKIDSSDCPLLLKFYQNHYLPYQEALKEYGVFPDHSDDESGEHPPLKIHEIEFFKREKAIEALLSDEPEKTKSEPEDFESEYDHEAEWTLADEQYLLSYHLRKRGLLQEHWFHVPLR